MSRINNNNNNNNNSNNNNNDKSSILSNITTTNTTTGTSTTNTTSVPSIKTKRGLSYILGDSNSNENHILPINSIQYSSLNNQLYTAGRDGNVKIWQPYNSQSYSNHHSTNSSQDDLFSDCLDLDEKLLRLETSISSNPLPYNYDGNTSSSNFNIVENYNLHFDWINDIQLINNDQNLISCSSDLSIKIIDLPTQHDNELFNNSHTKGTNIHKLPNIHTDYIKKLSPFITKPTIVSGGLDGKIIVWDLNELKPIQLIENKANGVLSPSIYSLANNHSNIISTGGPNNTVNIFDQRANNPFIRNLIGHQDNIRCLLMNDQFILSGSSDTTIKLWDLRTFKVYKNFDIHDDSIWSLYSQSTSHDSFKTFYSGDKSGNIIKTDLSRVSIFNKNKLSSNRDEFGFNNYENNFIDEKLGISTLIAKSTSPILSICHESEQDTVFATNMESMVRYINPDTCQLSQYQYLRQCLDYSYNTHNGNSNNNNNNNNNDNTDELLLHDGQSNPPTEDLNSDFYDLISHLSMDTHPNNNNNNNIDLQSTLSHGNNQPYRHFSNTTRPISLDAKASGFDDGDDNNDDDDDDENENENENILSREEFDSMFLNVNGVVSSEFINAFKDDTNPLMVKLQTDNSDNHNTTIDLTPIEILLNPIPIEQITLIPFNISPIEKYDLVPKSIVAKKMFNNRRQIMVLYLNGNIKIWDLVIFKIIKIFPYQQQKQDIPLSQKLLTNKELDNRIKEMEDLFEQYQTSDTLNNWCEVEIKSGKLLVTIKESSYLNVEIYYDELITSYPFLDINHSDNSSRFIGKTKPKVNNDDRFYLGIIMLNSIFKSYALYEQEFDFILREELKNLKQCNNPSISTNGGGNNKMLKYFGKRSSLMKNSTSSNQSSPVNSTNTSIIDVPIEKSSSNIGDNSFNNGTSSLYTAVNEFINTPEEVYEQSVNFDYGDTIMKLLQINKKIYWDKYNVPVNMTKGKVLESILGVDEIITSISKANKENNNNNNNNNGVADLRYYPIIRGDIHFPKDLLITIFEYSSDLGNYRDLFSFQYQDLMNLMIINNNNNINTNNTDSSNSSLQLIQDLRLMVPKWIGQPILFNKHPIKESPKITFQLIEVDYNQLPSNLKIGGKSNKKIKKLPELESSIKLTSHNMLRVSKILNYLVEKFANSTKEMKDKNLIPNDWLVLQCKGQELNHDLTLQTIKTKIWKSSSDIELQFRRKFDK
ncbi:conserved hypothetical protein [Candida dubliniensis CD36]|uniref:Uncharacterized protein n=1 Tax=Candida dubliniensis (strain CD36 / ATCC MYA-646 / CBS 7987 / NCPF 3949 / NRRL Y-17841) TaxID=573826 RepID=B9W9S1_CANDC|nr:conserved hypothetical protein [Candida dubliniensis CD36]CAX45556.1 conserved hypothetical protein [Candida dubliniensis CD36]